VFPLVTNLSASWHGVISRYLWLKVCPTAAEVPRK
jgi:hypothetical protein